MSQEVVDSFHKLYYDCGSWRGKTTWLGNHVLKCPLDLWVYQEIICTNKPDLIIETGTCFGGTTIFLSNILDLAGIKCNIVSIDICERPGLPRSNRITYLVGSSTKHHVLKKVVGFVRKSEKIMVILDSSHTRSHVIREMRKYGKFVTPGQYMIVEDSNINGRPVKPNYGPGPYEAISDFLNEDDSFVIDRGQEKYLLTFNPNGFLKKVKQTNMLKKSGE